MQTFWKSPYRTWLFIGLLLRIVTAWFSIGYNHPDEHFQILEYCNYKMGFSPASDLAWEYAARCRPGIQPFIAFCFAKLFYTIHLYNPFIVAFTLRLAMGICNWWITCLLILQLLPEFVTERGKKIFIGCTMLFWFMPYLGVRFSAENFSGTLFITAAYLLLMLSRGDNNYKPAGKLFITGLLLGFCVFARLQMVFAYLGLAIWLLFIKKWAFREWVWIIIAAIAAIGLSVVIDHWLYNAWTFTPYNYFDYNINKHVADRFGIYPWWWYFTELINRAILPIGVLLIAFFFAGVRFKPAHLFSLALLTFIIGHCAIGHKELRFLYPMILPFIFLSCIGADRLIATYTYRRGFAITMNILMAVNMMFLAYKAFSPAQEAVSYYHYMYHILSQPNTVLTSTTGDPFRVSELRVNYYIPENAQIDTATNQATLQRIINADRSKNIYYFSQVMTPGVSLPGYQFHKTYCILPGWLLSFNINNWEERSNIWTIYQVTPAAIPQQL